MDACKVQVHTGAVMKSATTVWKPCCAILALCAAAPAPAQNAGAAQFDNLVRSPYVHCAFYRQYDIDPRTGDRLLAEGRSDSLTHYQRQGGGRVRAIDTRRAGALEVQVVRGKKYLHFIERSAGMFVVTTVYACLKRDARTDTCINYGAVNARHFDGRVLRDPDAVYEDLQALAEPGFCDHSFLNLQEAARTSP